MTAELIVQAFQIFLSVDNLIVVFLGVLIGTIVGAIPGMTTPMGVALVLPFTFTMHPVTGILLLLGVYKGESKEIQSEGDQSLEKSILEKINAN